MHTCTYDPSARDFHTCHIGEQRCSGVSVHVHMFTRAFATRIQKAYMSRDIRFPTMWHFDKCSLLLSLETPNDAWLVA